MKSIILIFLMLLVLVTGSALNAKTNFQYPSEDKNPGVYSMEIIPDIKDNVSLVKFYISETSFVKITVSDEAKNKTEILTDHEIYKGEYCIYYKTTAISAKHKLVFKMQVMDKEQNNEVFLKQIILQPQYQKK